MKTVEERRRELQSEEEAWANPKRSVTVTRLQWDLFRLAENARLLWKLLPDWVKHLAGGRRHIEFCRHAAEHPLDLSGFDDDDGFETDLRQAIEMHDDTRKYATESWRETKLLLREVHRLMDDVGEELQHLRSFEAHNLDDDKFDLEPILKELARIETQAEKRCGITNEVLGDGPVRIAIQDEGDVIHDGKKANVADKLDPVIHAIALLTKHGSNKSAIAGEIGIPRTSMSGKKWEPFNLRYDKMKKGGPLTG